MGELDVQSWEEYQQKASVTAIYPHRGEFIGLLYTVCGLVGEARELFQSLSIKDKGVKELSDNFWFFSQVCFEAGISIEDVFVEAEELYSQKKYFRIDEPALDIIDSVCTISEVVSKAVRDDNLILSKEKRSKIQFELANSMCGFFGLCKFYQTPWQDVAKINLEKLYSRKDRGKLGGSGDDR
jgi:hypothetical protein